ncbi:HD domain-containing phosphohydrolase [Geomonas subterranea]|uniref:GAF domain-containing protein n=1 Tax=Geomonas subterranea TaxID=2847989 RepID=A0ABX8LMN4_9BACT|nr:MULTISPECIES: HD domain-containing phosphohydrolase [Geomonas]QXE92187.1 GAF domain-containing protein [Geomonas subterranea]QXM09714.1 GAF domain-containing protein [Geomonas subterranea]
MSISLKTKILTLITAILVVVISTVAYHNYRQQKEMLHEIANRNTSVLIETIKSSVANAMLSGRSDEVASIFAKIKSREFVKSIRIVDAEGKILNSADRDEIGTTIPQQGRPKLPSRNLSLLPEEGVFLSYARIFNAPQCYKCHPASKETLGLLEIKLSLGYMNGFISRERELAIVSAVLMVLLTMVTIFIFLVAYVERPIRKMMRCMEQVEQGNFDQEINLTSSQEMRSLGNSFNHMVGTIANLMESTVQHERELARAQEKLAHHRETHLMNGRLEEQIREIENLNVTLEERIEEIEEANYKIADLAGELEDKNTNLEKAVAKLSTLYRLGLAINSTIEVEDLYQLVVKTTMDTMQAQVGYVVLYDAEHGELRITNLIGYRDPNPQHLRVPMKPSSVSSWVIQNSKPLLITDITLTPEFDRVSPIGFERKTLICVPLMVKDEIIGTLTVVNKLNNTVYNHEELELLSTIAAQASIAIKNAMLYDEQQKTYLNTIQALVSAIEASDSYTRGHSERVTRFSLALARKLELPANRLKVIERAAILHDIGKIGIDLSLLHKEATLTRDDVAELQQHPTIGMKILEPIEFLHDVRLCIGQHHERYDGKGYPNRLAGQELLLESRILAIADSFDAMTSDRPYRKALKLEVAIQELAENAGTQFDPELVPIFIKLLKTPNFLPQREEYPGLHVVPSPSKADAPHSCIAQ